MKFKKRKIAAKAVGSSKQTAAARRSKSQCSGQQLTYSQLWSSTTIHVGWRQQTSTAWLPCRLPDTDLMWHTIQEWENAGKEREQVPVPEDATLGPLSFLSAGGIGFAREATGTSARFRRWRRARSASDLARMRAAAWCLY